MSVAYGELLALTHQIARDDDSITAAGIELHHWGPSPEGDAVAMFVRSDAAPAQEYMDGAYGHGRVVVHHTDDALAVRC